MNGARWRIVGLLFLLAFITIVDRVCISAAKQDIALDLNISNLSFGFVFGAFALGYSASMVPSGWAADALKPRRFLAIIVCLWSVFTVATGLVHSLSVLILIRVLFGAAEAGAFPAAARAIWVWVPVKNRGLALGLLNTGSRLGAAFGLAATSISVSRLGWRTSFMILGLVGFGWAIWWFSHFRDQPLDAAPDSRQNVPAQGWSELLTWNSSLLLFQYFASNFTFFICFSWLLPHLRSQYGLSAEDAGFYAGVPLYFGAAATWFSGMAVDRLYRNGYGMASRKLIAIAGFSLAAVMLTGAGNVTSAPLFIVLFAVTTFGVDFTLSPSWTACSDLGGSRTATLSGAMNACGSLGAFLSSICFPWLLSATHDTRTYFLLAALLNVLAAICWWKIRIGPNHLCQTGSNK